MQVYVSNVTVVQYLGSSCSSSSLFHSQRLWVSDLDVLREPGAVYGGHRQVSRESVTHPQLFYCDVCQPRAKHWGVWELEKQDRDLLVKSVVKAKCWWLTPITLATWEAEVRRIKV
jgi:hypothetical protein